MARLSSAFYNSDNASGLLNKDAIQCYHLIDLMINDGTLADKFLTDHIHDISYQSFTQGSTRTYEAAGGMIGFSNASEATAIKVGGITITLAGIEPEFVNDIMASTQLINKRVVIYRSFFETTYTAPSTSNTFVLFDGNIKDFSIEEGGDEAKISLEIATHWADFEKKNGRITNTASQHTTRQYNSTQLFNGDKGFDFASAMIGDIKWGPRS